MKNQCKFGKDESRMTGRGWQQATICNCKDIEFRYDANFCPYKIQSKCHYYQPIQESKQVEIKDNITVKNLEDLDDLKKSIRKKLEKGPVTIQVN